MIRLGTVLRLLLLVGCVAYGGLLGDRHDQRGLGLLAGSLVFLAGLLLWAAVQTAWWYWRPPLPACRSGQCRRPRDFTFLRRVDQGDLYQCRCGALYVHDRCGHRFLEAGPDGSPRPFLRHSRWGRWRPDSLA